MSIRRTISEKAIKDIIRKGKREIRKRNNWNRMSNMVINYQCTEIGLRILITYTDHKGFEDVYTALL